MAQFDVADAMFDTVAPQVFGSALVVVVLPGGAADFVADFAVFCSGQRMIELDVERCDVAHAAFFHHPAGRPR